jgi:nickel transport protein
METNYLLDAKLEFKSTYSSGEPVQGAKVLVYAPNNPSEPWLEGVTDQEGRFSFLPDLSIQGDWEVEIQQEGHEDYLTVPVGNQGVEVDLISEGQPRDIHYASLPWNPLAALGVTAGTAGLGVALWLSRRSRQGTKN